MSDTHESFDAVEPRDAGAGLSRCGCSSAMAGGNVWVPGRLCIGQHRAQVHAGISGGAMVVVQDAKAKPGSVMVRVEDVEAHHRQAKEKGAHVLGDPATFPYGERQYSVIDPAGHCWTFSQSVADVDPASWGGTLA